MNEPKFSRRIALTGLGAGSLSLVGGCWLTDKKKSDPDKELPILNLSFSVESQFRPFHLVAPEFEAVYAPSVGSVAGTTRSAHFPVAPFAAVELDVVDSGTGVMAGLVTETDEHLVAFYDPSRRIVGIEARRSGRTAVLVRTKARLPEAFKFSFVLCENQATVLADTGNGWYPLVTEPTQVARVVDMRDPETLAQHAYAWGARGEAGTVTLGDVRAGLFGMVGVRDLHLVQHSDGTPFMRDGNVYLTCTAAGLGFFQQAHWGVFTLDLDEPTSLKQTAQLFSSRDGLLLGDHAGQIVRDDDNDRWIVATSSWGDFSFDGVHVRHVVTTEDVLHGVHLLETERTALPTSVSAWDPGLTKINDTWHLGFVESPSQRPFDFHPALAAGKPGGDWNEDLRLVGAATDLHQCEGPIIAQVQDEWWFLASDGDNRHYPVFTMDMKSVGRLDAPYRTNIPHPQIVPLEGGHLLVTFNGAQYGESVLGYGGHGDVLVMRAH